LPITAIYASYAFTPPSRHARRHADATRYFVRRHADATFRPERHYRRSSRCRQHALAEAAAGWSLAIFADMPPPIGGHAALMLSPVFASHDTPPFSPPPVSAPPLAAHYAFAHFTLMLRYAACLRYFETLSPPPPLESHAAQRSGANTPRTCQPPPAANTAPPPR